MVLSGVSRFLTRIRSLFLFYGLAVSNSVELNIIRVALVGHLWSSG